MKMIIVLLLFVSVFRFTSAQTEPSDNAAAVREIKKEFLHAWNSYKEYAWGYDGVRPLSRQPYNWHASTLLLTPIDAFSTLKMMGFEHEANEAKKLILTRLSFNKDIT
ncbi:MAG: glycoside hydrolase family 47 protein, partial [Bacteroidetes bacterium]|nr:glycoside hydrolase family 47 protein [Bacteroidota bacterium]